MQHWQHSTLPKSNPSARMEESVENYAFFAMMARLRNINRWALMRNSTEENLAEHSLDVAMIAHALALIARDRFGKTVDPEKCALMGMYHDVSEILTGDMPTPVKYFNQDITHIYHEIEDRAAEHLLNMLPEDLQIEYQDLLLPDEESAVEKKLVKAADKISAYIKCINERLAGNREFASAETSTLEAIHAMDLPEVEVFLEYFLPAYEMTLDEVSIR